MPNENEKQNQKYGQSDNQNPNQGSNRDRQGGKMNPRPDQPAPGSDRSEEDESRRGKHAGSGSQPSSGWRDRGDTSDDQKR